MSGTGFPSGHSIARESVTRPHLQLVPPELHTAKVLPKLTVLRDLRPEGENPIGRRRRREEKEEEEKEEERR